MPEPLTTPMETPARTQLLGEAGLLGLLALLSAFVPLSTDMYLPALPRMTEALHASTSLVNLTLVLFFVCYSFGTLLWGPLSDKYGRRPILLCGLVCYILASACCACAVNISALIFFRVLQALGGSASPAIAVALAKDLYHGRKREKRLAMIQSLVMIAPIVAPVLGAMLLKFTSWRGVFWTLTGIGVVALLWSLALCETVVQRYAGSLLQTWGQLGVVLKNPGFTVLLITFSVIIMPLYGYLAASSYIYIREFRLSELNYSYFFAGNATCAVVAPLLYLALSKHVARSTLLTAGIAIVGGSGIMICLLGHLSPVLLALSIMPATLAMGLLRPPTTHLMLEQQQHATGSASALITFAMALFGSLAMLLMSTGWRSLIVPLGLLHLTAGLLSGALWLWCSAKPFIKQV